MKSQSLHNSTKNGFMIVYSDVTAFHEVPLTTAPPPPPPLFSVTQHHEKRWDILTHYA